MLPLPSLHRLLFCLTLLAPLALTGCSDGQVDNTQTKKKVIQPIMVGFDHKVVVPTSILRFRLQGTESMIVKRVEVNFNGNVNGATPVDWSYEAQTSDEVKADNQSIAVYREQGDTGNLLMDVPVSTGLWETFLGAQNGKFTGNIKLSLFDPFGDQIAEGTLDGRTLECQSELTPNVEQVTADEVFLNEYIELRGGPFLRPEEGKSYALIESGELSYLDGTTRQLNNVTLPIIWNGQRNQAALPISPSIFGVKVGTFRGDMTFINELSDQSVFTGNRQDEFGFAIQQSFISVPAPDRGARGQRIAIQGRGLIDTANGAGMTLIFEGSFQPEAGGSPIDFTGANAQERKPDRYLSDQAVEVAVWYDILYDGGKPKLTGLGAAPGVFTGTITPRMFDSFGNIQDGLPWSGKFTVLPTRQIVYLKYLPRFSQGLEKYGLRNVESEIRKAILAAAQRPYANTNVVFTDQPPADYIDFATIELSGPDPFGRKTFGLDNSFNGVAKDVNNLFLADYIGGWNQGSKENFDNPYGGIYIESFDYFSPTVSGQRADGSTNDDVSPEFDRALKPFMPALKGSPVKATEWPDGPRAAQIQAAIDLISRVIGHTVAHEAGHSMGMSFFASDRFKPGEVFHNRRPDDGYLMDPGSEITFEERAGLEGATPLNFNTRNAEYLQDILPKVESR